MAHCNNQYTYPDIFLWQDETYQNQTNAAGPLFIKLGQLMETARAESGRTDRFADRSDAELMSDEVNRVAYFPDYLQEWERKGMRFSCSGMMGLVMAPAAVQRHELPDARVLYIPCIPDPDDPRDAMNLLAENEDILEFAARENILVQFADCYESTHGAIIEKIIETQGTFRLHYRPILLDISLLWRNGLTLIDVSGLRPDDWSEPFTLGGRWVVDISDRLSLTQAHQHSISVIYRRDEARWHWDFERHIRSLAGKRQAESMHLEYDCKDHRDPKMAAFWKERGIRCEDHDVGPEWYMTLTPESAFQDTAHRIPLLIVMKELRTACPASTQTAFQFYYDFIEICARGEFAMLFFALETPEDNDEVLPGIIGDVCARYPVDPGRIYLAGQSHNGYYALEFYRRHPALIAACAQLCDQAGLQAGAVIDYYKSRSEEIITSFRNGDFPLIVINGELENRYVKRDAQPDKLDEGVTYFQNRLRALRIPQRDRGEILSAKASADYVTRKNGLPADRTELRYMMGDEVYISDWRNEEGKWHFRYASIENTPHMIMPQMAELSWEFMRRFARNADTGETVELY